MTPKGSSRGPGARGLWGEVPCPSGVGQYYACRLTAGSAEGTDSEEALGGKNKNRNKHEVSVENTHVRAGINIDV